MRKEIKSLKELIEKNKQDLLNDKQAMEKLEKRIEERHTLKRLA
ncbi:MULTISPECIES: FbpB family small basic protein [Cytobacillus]|jgi:Fur-regulated basic protein B|uniref:FbpB family small basic protein n=1 Tax=Cytobacillus pseudoceanisediminis TaxID=3051614 RepID=A0ABZ2ZEA5_9BACI|nr:FbpB family small basic protein [Cytobacillus oceanisediminis]MBY0155654.1 FbpB family small basic protein [Cytobacillus firmus]MBU8733540.1 FbpB family small basic protein [Cytobacillus oceanisediminis]MCM3246731.1 FbpB family small basic protein [Cytobacillus oceanisediminis]MCM3530150.1 FbpB family small basic protein [Cytobacillus oceanisediminis]MCS0823830.1 FbpB family small basic protein [Cytobacillus firmus]